MMKSFITIISLYLLVQIIYVAFFPLPFHIDSLAYYQLAQECLAEGRLYPLPAHIHHDYIIAPVYINFVLFLLAIRNDPAIILYVNIALNLAQLILLTRITSRLFGRQAAMVAALLYIFYLNNLGLVLQNLTELLFGVLLLSSFLLFLQGKWQYWIASGAVLGIAIGVRPTGWAMFIAFVIAALIQWRKGILGQWKSVNIAVGLAISVAVIGFGIKNYFGEFVYTSTTGSLNLLMGANDLANGAYNKRVFEPGQPGFLENSESLTFIEKGRIWTALAQEWIKENPLQWIKLIPVKLMHTFAWDGWAISELLHTHEWNLVVVAKIILKQGAWEKVLAGETVAFKIGFVALQIFHHAYYYGLLVVLALQVREAMKDSTHEVLKKSLPIYLFTLGGMAMYVLTVGDPRYKYPYLILGMALVAPILLGMNSQSES